MAFLKQNDADFRLNRW